MGGTEISEHRQAVLLSGPWDSLTVHDGDSHVTIIDGGKIVGMSLMWEPSFTPRHVVSITAVRTVATQTDPEAVYQSFAELANARRYEVELDGGQVFVGNRITTELGA